MKICLALKKIDHFYYHESFINEVIKKKHKLVIFTFDNHKTTEKTKKAIQEYCNLNNIELRKGIKRSKSVARYWIYGFREFRTVLHYFLFSKERKFYQERWVSYQYKPFKKLLKFPWLKKRPVLKFLISLAKGVEAIVLPDEKIVNSLLDLQVDLVLISPGNFRFSREIEYLKAAKKLKIRNAVLTYSWDNLCTKGLFHTKPDFIFVWNKSHYKQAIRYHNFLPKEAVIIGAGFFDKWFGEKRKEIILSHRNIFMDSWKLVTENSYILYLGSSVSVGKEEAWVVKKISEYLTNHPDQRLNKLKIIVRPHPANMSSYGKLELNNVLLWSEKGIFPGQSKERCEFFNAVFHSEAVVGINTSGMIDALIMDKPIISLSWDEFKDVQKKAPHFQDLIDSGCINFNEDLDSLDVLLMRILSSKKDGLEQKRKQFVDDYIRPFGDNISSGQMVMEYLSNSI